MNFSVEIEDNIRYISYMEIMHCGKENRAKFNPLPQFVSISFPEFLILEISNTPLWVQFSKFLIKL